MELNSKAFGLFLAISILFACPLEAISGHRGKVAYHGLNSKEETRRALVAQKKAVNHTLTQIVRKMESSRKDPFSIWESGILLQRLLQISTRNDTATSLTESYEELANQIERNEIQRNPDEEMPLSLTQLIDDIQNDRYLLQEGIKLPFKSKNKKKLSRYLTIQYLREHELFAAPILDLLNDYFVLGNAKLMMGGMTLGFQALIGATFGTNFGVMETALGKKYLVVSPLVGANLGVGISGLVSFEKYKVEYTRGIHRTLTSEHTGRMALVWGVVEAFEEIPREGKRFETGDGNYFGLGIGATEEIRKQVPVKLLPLPKLRNFKALRERLGIEIR